MKKALKIGVFAFAGTLALASCKKDWTCVCKNSSDYPIKNQTKKKAEEVCEGKVSIGLISASGNNGCYVKAD